MMRREKRPFVIEVKRGAKRAQAINPFIETPLVEDAQQRAEAALFGPRSGGDQGGSREASPPRRILEALAPEAEPIVVSEEPESRRGRKPGSKNKPRSAEELAEQSNAGGASKRRGRPPRQPTGAVRSVAVTAELANAALETIARATPVQTAPSESRSLFSGSAPAKPPKRGRGRPRKPTPDASRPAAPSWIAWSESLDEQPTLAPVMAVEFTPLRRMEPRPARTVSLKPGQRWMRRLRGVVVAARARRARKA